MGLLATRAVTVVAVTLCCAFTSVWLLPQVIFSVWKLYKVCTCWVFHPPAWASPVGCSWKHQPSVHFQRTSLLSARAKPWLWKAHFVAQIPWLSTIIQGLCCGTGVCLTGVKKQHLPWGHTVKNVVPLFQSSAKDDPTNAFDRLIIEEEIHSLILTETSESTNPEKENR